MGNPEVAELAVDLGPSFEVLPPRRPDEMTREADEAWVRRGFDFGCTPSPRKGPFSPGQVFQCKCWVLHKLEGHLTVSLTGRSEITETSETTSDSVTVSPVESHIFAHTSITVPGTAQGSYLPYVFSLTLPSAPNAGCFAGFQRPPPLPSSFEGSNAAVRLSIPFKVRNTASSAAWSAVSPLDPSPDPRDAPELYSTYAVEGSERVARLYPKLDKHLVAIETVEFRYSPILLQPSSPSPALRPNVFRYTFRALLSTRTAALLGVHLPSSSPMALASKPGLFGVKVWVEKRVAYRQCGSAVVAAPPGSGKGKGKGKEKERAVPVAGSREVRHEAPERMKLELLHNIIGYKAGRIVDEIVHEKVRVEVEAGQSEEEGKKVDGRVWVSVTVEGEAKLSGRGWNGFDIEEEPWLPRARTCNVEQRFDLCAALTELGKPLHHPVRFRDFQLDLPSPPSDPPQAPPPGRPLLGAGPSTAAAPAYEAAPAYDATFPGEPGAARTAEGGGGGEAPPAYEPGEGIGSRLKGLFGKGREKN
ncbi:hypothetical protein JCM8097_001492 [Rhodosporidiobolus ruineniae]